MNFERIAACIKNPHLLKASDLPELQKITRKYPYSSVLHYLYIHGVSRFEVAQLDDALSYVAFQVSDRRKLFELVQPQEMTFVEVQNSTINEHSIDDVKAETTETIATNLDERNISENKQREIEIVLEDLEETQSISKETQFDDLFYETTRASTNYFEVDDEIPDLTLLIKGKSQEITDGEAINTSKELTKTDDRKIEIIDSLETAELNLSVKEKQTFTGWLQSNNTLDSTSLKNSTVQESKSQSSSKLEEFMGKLDNSILSEEKQKSFKDKIKKEKNVKLIDQFITGEVKKMKPKENNSDNQSVMKNGLNSNTIPVSETLAKIYAKQGNFPKAIHVYHQLILAFPEKKSFFALQIQELKKKISE